MWLWHDGHIHGRESEEAVQLHIVIEEDAWKWGEIKRKQNHVCLTTGKPECLFSPLSVSQATLFSYILRHTPVPMLFLENCTFQSDLSFCLSAAHLSGIKKNTNKKRNLMLHVDGILPCFGVVTYKAIHDQYRHCMSARSSLWICRRKGRVLPEETNHLREYLGNL